MPGVEPTAERQELGETVLALIGGYRMGTALNPQHLFTKTAPGSPPPDSLRAADKRRILAA